MTMVFAVVLLELRPEVYEQDFIKEPIRLSNIL